MHVISCCFDLLFQLIMPSRNTSRELQFRRKILIVGIFVMSIIWGAKAQDPKAPAQGCQLLMCTKSNGKVALASIGYSTPNQMNAAQDFIAGQCPGVANVTKCDIECGGPYDSYKRMAYWTWR